MLKLRNTTPRQVIPFRFSTGRGIGFANSTKDEISKSLLDACNENDGGLSFSDVYPESLGSYTQKANGHIDFEDLLDMEHGIEFGGVFLSGDRIDGGRVVFSYVGVGNDGRRGYRAELLSGCYLENRS